MAVRVRRRRSGSYEVEVGAEDEALLAKAVGDPEHFIEALIERSIEMLREVREKVKREVLGLLLAEGKESVRLSEVIELLKRV